MMPPGSYSTPFLLLLVVSAGVQCVPNEAAEECDAASNDVVDVSLLQASLMVSYDTTKENYDESNSIRLVSKDELSANLRSDITRHVCITGSDALEVARDMILPAGSALAEFEMKSSAHPENKCMAFEHAEGQSLFTVSPSIADRCAARFKVHMQSCDVLVHAQREANCDELFKLRVIADHPHANLVVLHDNAGLLDCYKERVQTAVRSGLSPLPEEQMAAVQHFSLDGAGTSARFRGVLLTELKANREIAAKRRLQPALTSSDAGSIRQQLLETRNGKSSVVDVSLELMRHLQGLSANEKVLRALQRTKDNNALVVDVGSALTKAGFGGDDEPKTVFPTVVGRPRHGGIEECKFGPCVGDEAIARRQVLHNTHPVVDGLVVDWGDIEVIFEHAFTFQLGVSPDEHPVVLPESPLNTNPSREKMAQMMFERFGTPSLYFASGAELALWGSVTGATGMVVESGAGLTYMVPIYEGYSLTHAIKTMDFAGEELSGWMLQMLKERGDMSTAYQDTEIARDIKEKRAYVALDFDEEMKKAASSVEASYMLPTGEQGETITIGNERFRCPEALFQPSYLGKETPGIHELTHSSIMMCDQDIRNELYGNVVLAGGSTMFKGMANRMSKELITLAPSDTYIDVVAPTMFVEWAGGSFVSNFLDIIPEFFSWTKKNSR